jgi:hypothetical protein
MDNLYADIPSLGAKERAILRRQKIAEQLMAQGQAPLDANQMVGNIVAPVSPLAGIAKMLNVYSGNKQANEADTQYSELASERAKMVADEMAKFQQMSQGTPGQEIQGSPGVPSQNPQDVVAPTPYAPEQPAVAGDPRAAVTQAMMSQLPELQRFGQMELTNMNRKEDRADTQEFRAQEAQLAREARKQELMMRLEDSRLSNADRIAAQKEIAQMNIDSRNDIARLVAASKTPPQAQIIQTANGPMQLVGGQAKPIVGPDGKPVQGAKGGRGGMSATAQKELIQTDEEVMGADMAVKGIDEALAINDKAMGFSGASTIANAASVLPESIRPDAVDATTNLDNIIQNSALPQLKAIFGGMPTEGERKILLDVQGSSSKTPAVRKKIFDRAKVAIQTRQKFAKQKASQLREGTYFSGEGGTEAPAEPRVVDW